MGSKLTRTYKIRAILLLLCMHSHVQGHYSTNLKPYPGRVFNGNGVSLPSTTPFVGFPNEGCENFFFFFISALFLLLTYTCTCTRISSSFLSLRRDGYCVYVGVRCTHRRAHYTQTEKPQKLMGGGREEFLPMHFVYYNKYIVLYNERNVKTNIHICAPVYKCVRVFTRRPTRNYGHFHPNIVRPSPPIWRRCRFAYDLRSRGRRR